MHRHGWTTLQLVWRETPELFHARDPFPIGGVIEDPATGAAAAAFGGYLRTLGALPPSGAFTIRQGEDLGRPSLLRVEASLHGPARASERAGGAGRGREREHRRGRGLSELAAAALSRARCPAGPG